METLNRKQLLKNGLISFVENTKNDNNVYSAQTDINVGYWIYNGAIFENKVFNLCSAKKVKNNSLDKNTVYYVSTIKESQLQLFNII
jgi:hypothetical protein